MKKSKTIFILFLLTQFYVIGSGMVFADDTKFTASVGKTEVSAGERFQVTFQINTSGSGFTPPSLENFSVLSGPNQSTSMQWVNGAMSSSISYSYILVAPREGDFTIGSAGIKANGKTYTTDPIKIKVVKGAPPPPQQTQKGQQQPQNQSGQQGGNVSDYVFIKLNLDKAKAFLGEQIIATYKIYMRANIVNNDVDRLPTFNGFWTQEIELPQQANVSQEVMNGISYNVAYIKQTILFPQRTGTLEVDPLGLNVVLRLQDNSRQRSIFDQFFGSYRDVKYAVKSNAVKIEILPLPENGKPAGFNGAVGKFTMESTLNKNHVKVNEAINLKISISGKGNIKLIEPFKISFPSDFETYDPKTNDKIVPSASGLTGKKEFDYLAIPRHSGNFNIEPVTFSFFDPSVKQFVTLKSGEMKIEVEKGAENEPAGTYTSVNREEVKFLGKDIRFIKSDLAGLKKKNEFFFCSFLFWILFACPIFIFFLLLVLKGKYESYQQDVTGLKSRRATRVATKRLSVAKNALKANERIKFYEEIFKALYGYLSDKLSIPVSDLSKEKISEILLKRNLSEDIIVRLISVLDRCEMARFAPMTDIPENIVYENSVEIISKIEEGIK